MASVGSACLPKQSSIPPFFFSIPPFNPFFPSAEALKGSYRAYLVAGLVIDSLLALVLVGAIAVLLTHSSYGNRCGCPRGRGSPPATAGTRANKNRPGQGRTSTGTLTEKAYSHHHHRLDSHVIPSAFDEIRIHVEMAKDERKSFGLDDIMNEEEEGYDQHQIVWGGRNVLNPSYNDSHGNEDETNVDFNDGTKSERVVYFI